MDTNRANVECEGGMYVVEIAPRPSFLKRYGTRAPGSVGCVVPTVDGKLSTGSNYLVLEGVQIAILLCVIQDSMHPQ